MSSLSSVYADAAALADMIGNNLKEAHDTAKQCSQIACDISGVNPDPLLAVLPEISSNDMGRFKHLQIEIAKISQSDIDARWRDPFIQFISEGRFAEAQRVRRTYLAENIPSDTEDQTHSMPRPRGSFVKQQTGFNGARTLSQNVPAAPPYVPIVAAQPDYPPGCYSYGSEYVSTPIVQAAPQYAQSAPSSPQMNQAADDFAQMRQESLNMMFQGITDIMGQTLVTSSIGKILGGARSLFQKRTLSEQIEYAQLHPRIALILGATALTFVYNLIVRTGRVISFLYNLATPLFSFVFSLFALWLVITLPIVVLETIYVYAVAEDPEPESETTVESSSPQCGEDQSTQSTIRQVAYAFLVYFRLPPSILALWRARLRRLIKEPTEDLPKEADDNEPVPRSELVLATANTSLFVARCAVEYGVELNFTAFRIVFSHLLWHITTPLYIIAILGVSLILLLTHGLWGTASAVLKILLAAGIAIEAYGMYRVASHQWSVWRPVLAE